MGNTVVRRASARDGAGVEQRSVSGAEPGRPAPAVGAHACSTELHRIREPATLTTHPDDWIDSEGELGIAEDDSFAALWPEARRRLYAALGWSAAGLAATAVLALGLALLVPALFKDVGLRGAVFAGCGGQASPGASCSPLQST